MFGMLFNRNNERMTIAVLHKELERLQEKINLLEEKTTCFELHIKELQSENNELVCKSNTILEENNTLKETIKEFESTCIKVDEDFEDKYWHLVTLKEDLNDVIKLLGKQLKLD